MRNISFFAPHQLTNESAKIHKGAVVNVNSGWPIGS